MLRQIRPAIILLLLMTALTGFAYPLAMTGVAAMLFPSQAGGSLIRQDGKLIGSTLIGQNFSDPRYFHGRPSATSEPDPNDPSKTVATPYAADNSAGSNLGPTSKALINRVAGDVTALRKENPSSPVPVDLVTTSGSGLDPDMTPAAAAFQVSRVAAARGLPLEKLQALVGQHTEARVLGIFGEPRVNVLKLNLALDALR
jgi:K+-transporting ATPase ATPase C chain